MVYEIKLDGLTRKSAVMLTTLAACLLLTFAAFVSLIVGLLADQRATPSRELLADGVAFAPSSASLLGRLAEAEMQDPERDLSRVEAHAERAVNLSPWDYRRRVLLAAVEEAKGDRGAAEQSLQKAVALAPNCTDVHWRFGNLLLREGKLEKSVEHFLKATSSNPSLLPLTLDLLWR